MSAIRYDRKEMAHHLLPSGANVEHQDMHGQTALLLASTYCHSINQQRYNGLPAIMIACIEN
jgi:hypothetical protein